MGACNSAPPGGGSASGRARGVKFAGDDEARNLHPELHLTDNNKSASSDRNVESPGQTGELGRALWEYRETRIAALVTAIFCVIVFTCFAHNVLLGSFWCPFSQCPQNLRAIETDSHHLTQQLVISTICLFLDIFVITYHITHPVHPKYAVTKLRKRVMSAHIVSGALQTVLGPTVWLMHRFAGDELRVTVTVLSRFLVIWGFAVHTPTALFLLRTPFGAVRMMMPAFIFVVAMYCYVLGELWTDPYEALGRGLVEWWIMTHIYVLNRFTFSILANLNILAGARYSVSILLGSAVCMPASLGSTSMCFLFAAIMVFNVAFVLTMDPDHHIPDGEIYSAGGEGVSAKVKKHFVRPEGVVRTGTLRTLEKTMKLTDRDVANHVFHRLDVDHGGTIDIREIGALLTAWGLPSYVAEEVMHERDVNQDGRINEEEFFANFRDVWEFAASIALQDASGVHGTSGPKRGRLVSIDTAGKLHVGMA